MSFQGNVWKVFRKGIGNIRKSLKFYQGYLWLKEHLDIFEVTMEVNLQQPGFVSGCNKLTSQQHTLSLEVLRKMATVKVSIAR